MRPETLTPSDAVLDLLARADALAASACAAIATGDESQLAAVLDEREAVIDAIARVWREPSHSPTPQQRACVTRASHATLERGLVARNTAIIARDAVVGALAALDARQLASHEYHTGTPHGTIDVVL
jgi:hypothetical protein